MCKVAMIHLALSASNSFLAPKRQHSLLRATSGAPLGPSFPAGAFVAFSLVGAFSEAGYSSACSVGAMLACKPARKEPARRAVPPAGSTLAGQQQRAAQPGHARQHLACGWRPRKESGCAYQKLAPTGSWGEAFHCCCGISGCRRHPRRRSRLPGSLLPPLQGSPCRWHAGGISSPSSLPVKLPPKPMPTSPLQPQPLASELASSAAAAGHRAQAPGGRWQLSGLRKKGCAMLARWQLCWLQQ